MKRLDIFKSASDFAFVSLQTSDPVQLDIQAADAFQKANLSSDDYQYWKQCFQQCRMQYSALANQLAPSAMKKPAQQPQPVTKPE